MCRKGNKAPPDGSARWMNRSSASSLKRGPQRVSEADGRGAAQHRCHYSSPIRLVFMKDSKGWIFAAGVLALAFSIYLWFSGSKQAAIFVGLWVPSLWILADLVEQSELSTS